MATAISSCKKDEYNNPMPGKTKADILTSKIWKQTARTISPTVDINDTMVTDLYALDYECDKDDLYKFKKDNTFTQDEGATKCDPSDPQVYAFGTWAFNADETQLILNYTGVGSFTSNILEVTETTARLSEIDIINGVEFTTIITYTAQ